MSAATLGATAVVKAPAEPPEAGATTPDRSGRRTPEIVETVLPARRVRARETPQPQARPQQIEAAASPQPGSAVRSAMPTPHPPLKSTAAAGDRLPQAPNDPARPVTPPSAVAGVVASSDVPPAPGAATAGEAATAAAKHTAPAPQAQPAPVPQQVAVQILESARSGHDRLRLQLQPRELGQVEVTLELREGRLQVTILAERPEALQQLQQGARSLERALLDAGFDLDSSQLHFAARDGDDKGRRGPGDGAPRGSGPDATDQQAPAIVGRLPAEGLLDLEL